MFGLCSEDAFEFYESHKVQWIETIKRAQKYYSLSLWNPVLRFVVSPHSFWKEAKVIVWFHWKWKVEQILLPSSVTCSQTTVKAQVTLPLNGRTVDKNCNLILIALVNFDPWWMVLQYIYFPGWVCWKYIECTFYRMSNKLFNVCLGFFLYLCFTQY